MFLLLVLAHKKGQLNVNIYSYRGFWQKGRRTHQSQLLTCLAVRRESWDPLQPQKLIKSRRSCKHLTAKPSTRLRGLKMGSSSSKERYTSKQSVTLRYHESSLYHLSIICWLSILLRKTKEFQANFTICILINCLWQDKSSFVWRTFPRTEPQSTLTMN